MQEQLEPTPKRRADARRNRTAVLEAAVRLLPEQPGASMREIADASGVGRTTVYRHFPTRDDLMRALFRQILQESRAIAAAIAERELPVPEALRAFAAECVDLGERYRFLQGQRHLRDEVLATEDPYADPFEAYVRAAQERGDVRGDMPVEWLMAMLRGQTMAGIEAMNSGGSDRETTARLLGESLVSVFVSEDALRRAEGGGSGRCRQVGG